MISYSRLVERTERGVAFVTTAWIPQRPWVGVVSGGAFWYGRRVALTYAPGMLADRFIRLTVTFVGSETAGKFIGTTVVAPMLTPSITPMAAMAFGSILFYIVALISNLGIKCFANCKNQQVEDGVTGQPSPTGSA